MNPLTTFSWQWSLIWCGSCYYVDISLSSSSSLTCLWSANCWSIANQPSQALHFHAAFPLPSSNFQLTRTIVTMTDFIIINCHIICLTVGLVSASTKQKQQKQNKFYIKLKLEKRKTITWNAWKMYCKKESQQADKCTNPFEHYTNTWQKWQPKIK